VAGRNVTDGGNCEGVWGKVLSAGGDFVTASCEAWL
jgi:hypothetical protein